MSALMLLLLIGTALIARSQAELGAAGADADAEAAQAAAEQGVAEVLARLEAGERGDFGGDGQAGEGKFGYKVEQIAETEFFVRSEGYFGERVRAVEVTISGGGTTSPAYTMFINHKAGITDNRGSITGTVGTNGPIYVRGNPPGDSVDLYGRDAECDGCRVENKFEDQLDMPDPELPTGKTQDCPSDGRFIGTINGEGGIPYVCTPSNVRSNEVRFVRTIDVINPPLIIHVTEGLDVRFNNASVNTDGEPTDFQVYAEGDNSVYWWFDLYNSKVHGVLYAPNRDWIIGSVSIYGSVSGGVVQIQSPDDVWLTPFESGVTPGVSGGWMVTSWEQVPAR